MNRRFDALTLGLAIAVAGVLAISVPRAADVEQTLGLQWLFAVRGTVRPPSDVVIVAMDGASARQLGLPEKPREWPRQLHAAATRFLARAGARVISFDLTFDAAGASSVDDQAFASAIAEAGNVLLSDSLRTENISVQGPDGRVIGGVEIERPVPPNATLEQAAAGHAPFLLPKGSRVDAYWTFRGGAGDAPTLPVMALQLYASGATDDFIALLRQVDSRIALPNRIGERTVANADEGRRFAISIREAMRSDPALAHRMLARLRDTGGRDNSSQRERLVRALVTLYSADEMSFLDFYGPARTIATVPYHRVIEAARSLGAQPAPDGLAALFRDKAVFVGYAAASQSEQDLVRDDYRTVFSQSSGLDISGVEIAATAFANLLDGRPIRGLERFGQIAIVALWGLVLGVACRLLRPGRAAVLAAVLASAYAVVAFERFADASIWLPSIVPLGVQLPAALVAGLLLNYRESRRERELVKQAFAQFLPSSVVDQLAQTIGPVTSANRLVYGACLATDVERYTTLAETMDPQELGTLMNAYYAEMFGPVERLGGIVDDVVGDAMVAVWAATSADARLRDNACEAALEIVAAVDRFNRAKPGRPPLPTRFGLHSGHMLLGSIGASRHYEYRAVGDIVNTASRIQGLNKTLGTTLLASAQTVEGLHRFATRPLGSFLMAGKTSAVAVVEIAGFVDAIDGARVELHAMFAAALDEYCAGRWREAAERFAAILRPNPNDGPSRFYASRCEELLRSPPATWTPTLRIDVK